jgi:hypothetical protein
MNAAPIVESVRPENEPSWKRLMMLVLPPLHGPMKAILNADAAAGRFMC